MQWGVILKTSDGGGNWVVQDSGTPLRLYSIVFINSNTGYAVGGGAPPYTYDSRSGNPSCTWPSIPFYVAMLKTTDGGSHWIREKIAKSDREDNSEHLYYPPNTLLHSVSCLSTGVCAAAGTSGIWMRK